MRDHDRAGVAIVGLGSGIDPVGENALGRDVAGMGNRDRAGVTIIGIGAGNDPVGPNVYGPDVTGMGDRNHAGVASVGKGSGIDPVGAITLCPDVAGMHNRDCAGVATGGIRDGLDTGGEPARGGEVKFPGIAVDRDVATGVRIKVDPPVRARCDVRGDALNRECGVGIVSAVVDGDPARYVPGAGDVRAVGGRTWSAVNGERRHFLRTHVTPVTQEHHSCRHRAQQPGAPGA